MGTAHALLSPSAAKRWLNCTPSALLEAAEPDTRSPYAEEGTLAHALCALKLKDALGRDSAGERADVEALAPKWLDGEMEEHAQAYADYVLGRFREAREATPDARLFVEERLDLSEHVPGSFGTADALIVGDGMVEVVDFKYGKGVEVRAEHNEQLMLYALGAHARFSLGYAPGTYRLTIIQPRLGNCSSWAVGVDALLEWAEEAKPKAAAAAKGEGEAEPGEWCRFCRVKAKCRALADRAKAAAQGDPRLLTAAELGRDVLPALGYIKSWAAAVEEHALAEALAGRTPEGWKLVEGRSIRKVADPAGVEAALLAEGFARADIYKPEELRGITELEKLAGKKRFAGLCGSFIQKPAGKPALAPLSDKRPAVSPAALDFDGVEAPAGA